MSIDNTSEDTLNNTVLQEDDNAPESIVGISELQQKLDEAKLQLRKSNFKVEQELKEKKEFTRQLEETKDYFSKELESLKEITIQKLAEKEVEIEDLKKIVGVRASEAPQIQTEPVNEKQTDDGMNKSKLDFYRSQMR